MRTMAESKKAKAEKAAAAAAAEALALDKDVMADAALATPKALAALVADLAAEDRARRAASAKAVHEVACREPKALSVHIPDLIDALDRPEAQTRWEILGALEEIAAVEARSLKKAVASATVALHDGDSSVVREAAFRMLSAYGASSGKRAEEVWPLLDEALRCYHGDPEYVGMLAGVVKLVEGAAPESVREAAAEVTSHDLNHPKTIMRLRARRIQAIAPKKEEVPEEEE
jgi:hypothetical protein